MAGPHLFAQITKVDEAKRLVYGRAVQEIPDRADEIFDYASSKPHFVEWSKGFSDATDGKSLGNIRAMHGKTMAGVAKQIDFNDDAKAIDIAAHIIDNNEWEKVIGGGYTGFSIGGSYVGDKITEKFDGRDVRRYTAKPIEISLVDSPCIPTAKFFEIVKADGAVAKINFKPAPIEVTGTDEQVGQFAQAMNDSGITLADAIKLVNGAAAQKAIDSMLDTEESLSKREFSTDERKSAAKEGTALPDGSFPIKTVGDLENAIKAYGRAKDKAAAKAHIIKRAKALGASDKIPSSWAEKIADGKLRKDMWNVSSFCQALCTIAGIARSAQSESDVEEDDSPVPASLRNWLEDGISIFQAMSDEESTELLAELKQSAGVGENDDIDAAIEMASKIGMLKKQLADPDLSMSEFGKIAAVHLTQEEIAKVTLATLQDTKDAIIAKASTKLSAANMDRLQAAHDHLVAIGASCSGEKSAANIDLAKGDIAAQLAKALADIEMLKAQPVQHPHVVLRMVQKGESMMPSVKTIDPNSVTLEKIDYVYNLDGTVDVWTSRQQKAYKMGLAASAAAS